MATKEVITKVWIEDGCIVCDACETAAPDVFEVLEDTCVIRPAALTPEFTKPRSGEIADAAEECPVDVIKFDVVKDETAGESEDAPSAAPQVAEAPAQPAQPEKVPAAPAPAEPAAAKVAPAKVSVAGASDPSIAALLQAATSRGGQAGIMRRQEEMPDDGAWRSKAADELPPEARQAKVMEAAQKTRKNPDKQRRAFMSNTALALGWGAFGLGAGITVGPAFARFMMPNVLEESDPRIRVGKIQRYLEMIPGQVNEDYKPQGIWMVRDGDRLAALSIICTHLGCIPNWLPNDRKFKCPCHGSGYKPDGINFEGPTPRPLERFRVFVEDGIVVVDKSKKYQYELGQWDQPGSYLEM
jgi:cytochrome b6-f complex iron-sulfur subunit